MSKVERTETFYLDSRKVTINFLKPSLYYIRDPQLFIDTILKICRKNKYAMAMPEVVFNIEFRDQYHREGMSGYAHSDLGNPTVVLISELILREGNIFLRHNLKKIVVHEITHLWHDYVYQAIKSSYERYRRLMDAFYKAEHIKECAGGFL